MQILAVPSIQSVMISIKLSKILVVVHVKIKSYVFNLKTLGLIVDVVYVNQDIN